MYTRCRPTPSAHGTRHTAHVPSRRHRRADHVAAASNRCRQQALALSQHAAHANHPSIYCRRPTRHVAHVRRHARAAPLLLRHARGGQRSRDRVASHACKTRSHAWSCCGNEAGVSARHRQVARLVTVAPDGEHVARVEAGAVAEATCADGAAPGAPLRPLAVTCAALLRARLPDVAPAGAAWRQAPA